MASRSINDLHPQLAFAYGQALGMWLLKYPDDPIPFLTATYRSPGEQDLLFAQPTDRIDNDGDGRIDEPDERVTNARGDESAHNYLPALALDVAFQTSAKKLDWSTRLFEQFAGLMFHTPNITWGANFKTMVDRPHFELTDWKTRVVIPQAKPSQIPPVPNKLPPPPPPARLIKEGSQPPLPPPAKDRTK